MGNNSTAIFTRCIFTISHRSPLFVVFEVEQDHKNKVINEAQVWNVHTNEMVFFVKTMKVDAPAN